MRALARQADVFCFSPYTHGELGIAATACQHVLLTLPNGVEGHQQTAHMMAGDVLSDPLPIASGPRWGVPEGVGLGVEPAPAAIEEGHRRYELEGQFLPYRREHLQR